MVPAVPDSRKAKRTRLVCVQAKMLCKRFACNLGDRCVLSSRLTIERRPKRVRQRYRCALHTCILASPETVAGSRLPTWLHSPRSPRIGDRWAGSGLAVPRPCRPRWPPAAPSPAISPAIGEEGADRSRVLRALPRDTRLQRESPLRPAGLGPAAPPSRVALVRISRQLMPSPSSAGRPRARAVRISTAWRMIP